MVMEDRIAALLEKFQNKIDNDEHIREEVKDLDKTLNINLETEGYSLRFADCKISDFKPELLEKADITLETSVENFGALLDGTLRPMKAYVTKKVKLKGKIQDVMFLKKFF